MSAKAILGVMIAGPVAVMLFVARRPEPPPPPAPVLRPLERPWLTREEAAQVVEGGGGPGSLFADVELGGPAPTPAVRSRIDEFARAHGIDVDFEVIADELTAIRFGVTYGGCCGYEGADALASRLSRPRAQNCCGCDTEWVDDWAVTLDASLHVRGRVRVNRVEVRWERTATATELIERAASVVGQARALVREAAGDRWTELEPGQRYLLEVPYPFTRTNDFGVPPRLDGRDDLGLQVLVERGRITEVSFVIRDLDEDAQRELKAALRKTWGRPRVVGREPTVLAWRTATRSITADLDGPPMRIVIRAL